jgi:hypothetical protein
MSNNETVKLKTLKAFLAKNQTIDFRTANLLYAVDIDKYEWKEFEQEKESLIEQLKAYQRMLRVVPQGREELAEKLLENGIQSSLQIAGTPKKIFIKKHLKLFDENVEIAQQLAEQVYQRAIAIRKVVALQYIARTQQAEPHARMTGLMR